MKKHTASARRVCFWAVILFFLLAFALAAVREGDSRLWTLAAAVPAVILLCGTVFSRLLSMDRLLAVVSVSLAALGILLAAEQPELAVPQALRSAGALFFLFLGVTVIHVVRLSVTAVLVPAVIALAMLVVPLAGTSLSVSLDVPAVSLLMFAFVTLLSMRLRVPALLLALAGTVLLLARPAPAAAAVWSLTFLLLFWAAGGHPAYLLISVCAVVLTGLGASMLRPDLFAAPADAPVPVLSAAAPLSFFGPETAEAVPAELGLDAASLLPAAAIRYGLVFAACMALLYPALFIRGTSLANASRGRFHGLAAMGSVLLLGLSAVSALLGDFGLSPVEALPLPLLSADLVSLASSFFLIGLLCGVSARNKADLEEDARLSMLAQHS